jgi:microcystin-dependent protein
MCAGQILAISQNTALFSLLGTTYGGNGTTTFALPDLRGRVPVGIGQGPGLSNVNEGEVSGSESVTLQVNQMPSHAHLASVTQSAATSSRPSGKVPSAGGAYADAGDGSMFNATHVQNAGGGQPFSIRSPYLGLIYIIALQGIFPSRN